MKSKKLPLYWSSYILLRYKPNVLLGELHRANKMASNFSSKLKIMKIKYLQEGFQINVVNDVIRDLTERKMMY